MEWVYHCNVLLSFTEERMIVLKLVNNNNGYVYKYTTQDYTNGK